MNPVLVRSETPSDFNAIHDLIVEVFYETFGSGEAEASLVEQIRGQPQYGPIVSLVAEQAGLLVGHILFSAVEFEAHPDIPICALAPLGVYRQYQRQGIGSQLVTAGLKECTNLGYKAVVVQGSLEYYPRFGFLPIAHTELHTTFHSDHDMILEIEVGLLKRVSGLVAYPEPWQVFL